MFYIANSMFTRSKIALIAIAIMLVYITFNLCNWERKNLMQWDETGYYLYLPATFIYHDISNLYFYPTIVQNYYINGRDNNYGLYTQPTTYKLNKYPVGTSLFELPFFLIADRYCLAHSKEYDHDGYSQPYLVAVCFATIFWVFAGLCVLRRFLLRYFTEGATAVTLILLAFATNLYFYTVFDIGMSHPFSFAAFCFLLYATERWYATGHRVHALLLGLLLGLIVITRPTNIVVALIPLCWKYKDGTIAGKLNFFKKQLLSMVLAAILFFLLIMIQLCYWKHVTGHWVHFSYESEGFDFLSPQVWNGLFSYRKGWFVYTPVAFIAVLGLIPLARQHKRLAAITAGYLLLSIYIIFSWCNWTYGGSFGCRSLIESMVIAAMPLTMFIQWVFAQKKIAVNILLLTVFSFMIALNAFQSYQLVNNKTVWDGTNRAFYWRTFGKLNVTEEDKKLLSQP